MKREDRSRLASNDPFGNVSPACAVVSPKPGAPRFFYALIPVTAVLVWAAWQKIKPKRIWMPMVANPWGVKR